MFALKENDDDVYVAMLDDMYCNDPEVFIENVTPVLLSPTKIGRAHV